MYNPVEFKSSIYSSVSDFVNILKIFELPNKINVFEDFLL